MLKLQFRCLIVYANAHNEVNFESLGTWFASPPDKVWIRHWNVKTHCESVHLHGHFFWVLQYDCINQKLLSSIIVSLWKWAILPSFAPQSCHLLSGFYHTFAVVNVNLPEPWQIYWVTVYVVRGCPHCLEELDYLEEPKQLMKSYILYSLSGESSYSYWYQSGGHLFRL